MNVITNLKKTKLEIREKNEICNFGKCFEFKINEISLIEKEIKRKRVINSKQIKFD